MKRPGFKGLLGEILVRPNMHIFVACFACGVLLGAALYMKQQETYVSVLGAYSEPVTFTHLQ